MTEEPLAAPPPGDGALPPAALAVLDLVSAHGLHVWIPGFTAVLNDPSRTRVDRVVVDALVTLGYLAEVPGAAGLSLTELGRSAQSTPPAP